MHLTIAMEYPYVPSQRKLLVFVCNPPADRLIKQKQTPIETYRNKLCGPFVVMASARGRFLVKMMSY